MSDKSPSDESKLGRDPSKPVKKSSKKSAETAAARAARRLKRVAPTTGESKLARISRARRANKGPVKHPRDLLGVSLADGRYVVKAPLGKGSMAYVFRASDARLQTDVVLKVPKPEKVNTADFRERFQRESQMLIRFSHPHVVKVLDVGEYSELPYVVMQLLEGGSLSDRIAREADENGCMTPESLKTWVREVARALDFCYRKGMVHRDVKPANILFDEDNNAYVGDFGLSKIMCGEHTELSSDETAAGVVLGTPNYISPEVVQGKDYDGRSDQYSLGITIYHVLTGGPPMQGNTATMTMLNQTQKVLPLLSDVRSDVPRPLAVAVRKAIEKDPAKRFNTCEEFTEAVVEGLRFPPMISTSSNSSAVKTSRRPALPTAGDSASSVGKAKVSPSPKRPAKASAKGSARKERKAVDAKRASSKSSIRKSSKRRQAAPANSSRSSRRTTNSASSSLASQADMDWFDMNASGEYLPGRSSSSSRSSSKSSVRRSVKKGKSTGTRLVNVFGQKLHPAVLTGLVVASAFCLLMVVWSPWNPDVVTPELVAGQYDPPLSSAKESSQKPQGEASAVGKENGKVAAGKQGQATAAKSDSSKAAKSTILASGEKNGQPNVTVAVSEPAGSSLNEVAQSTTTSTKTKPLSPAVQKGPDQKTPVDIAFHQNSEPLFEVPAGAVTLFGDGSAKVFVSGRAVRSRDTADQKAILSGQYSADGISVLSDDGKWFAATVTDRLDRDFLVRVWDTATGKIQLEIPGDGRRRVRNLFLSGQFLYLETDRATELRAWNLRTKRQQAVLSIPSNRLRSQRMAMTKDGSAFGAIVNDQYVFIDGRSGAVMTSLKAPMLPAIQVAMAESSTNLAGQNSHDLVQSTQSLRFSDDQLQLAAVRTMPEPTLTTWNETGELQHDLAFGIAATTCQPETIHWFAQRSAWLVNGSVLDAKYRRVVVSVPHDDDQVATIGLQDDNHLLTSLRHDVGHVYRREIPWQQIDDSLKAMLEDETALLRPGASVQVSVEEGGVDGMGIASRSMLERSIEKKLRTQQLEVAEDSKLRFQLRSRKVPYRDDVVSVLELIQNDEERVIWYAVVGQSLPFGAEDFAAQRAIAETIGQRISTLAIPYYVPADATRLMLPYCIDQ